MMKLQFLILTQEKLKLRKRPDKTMKRKTTLSDDQKDRVAKQVQTALEVSKVKRRTEFLMWLVGVGLIVLPTLILIIYSLVKAENDNPGILLEKDFQACLPEPDSILYVSPIIGLLLAALAMGGIIVMRNSFDELGIRIEIMRNVIIWGVMYIAINGVRANQTNEWQPFLVVIQQMLLSYSMIVMPCHNTNNPLICGKSNQVTPIESSMSRSYNDSSGSASGSGNDSSRYSIGSQHSQLDSGLSMSFFNSGLESLLETDEGVNMFSRYCAKEFSVENINFWLAVREFQLAAAASAAAAVVFRISERMNENEEDGEGEGDKMVVEEIGDDDLEKENDPDQNRPQQQNKPDPGQLSPAMRDEANEIFSEFVKIGSAMQVNLPSRLQKQIAKNVNEEKINADIFADGQKEIFSLMSRDSYQRFLKVNKKKLERAAKKKVHGASMGKFARKLSASPMRMGMGQ